MVHDPLRTGPASSGQVRTPNTEGDGDRVAKALARAGVASRREVERLIEAGRVALNGVTLTTPAVKVEPGDILTVDGQVVGDAEPTRLFRYHKPVGVLTSHSDPHGRPTVFEALPDGLPRLISVGRLDINSEGLLLLTNDGGLARALELPATALARRYRARAHGRVTQERLDKLKQGITVEGVRYGAIEATLDKVKEGPAGANLWVTVTLAEGKNREVRRVLEAIGLKVNRLLRLSYGPFALGTLMPGELEEVGPRVIREQMADYIDAANLPTGDRPQFRKTGVAAGARRAPPSERQPPSPRRASPTDASEKVKKTYKAGWAKAKPPKPGGIKGRPAPKASAQPEPKRFYPPKPPAKTTEGRSAGAQARPPGKSRPAPGSPRSDKPRSGPPRSGPPRAGPSRSASPRSGPAKSGSPRPGGGSRPGSPRPSSPKSGPRGPKPRG